MPKATFLEAGLFEDHTNDESNESQIALLNLIYDDYYTVLRKELCLAAADRFENKILPSENAEFLLAIYRLHKCSQPKSGYRAYTPAKLLEQLTWIIESFRFNDIKYSALNISSAVLQECLQSLNTMISLINNNPHLLSSPLKNVLSENLDWGVAYSALQEAIKKAFLEIKSILNVNAIQRNFKPLQRVKEFIHSAKTFTAQWDKRIDDLMHKLNKYPIADIQDKLLYTKLMNCRNNISIIDDFIKSPIIFVDINEFAQSPSIFIDPVDNIMVPVALSYFEFQASLILKLKFLLKGIEQKKDLGFYQASYNALADKYVAREEIHTKLELLATEEDEEKAQAEQTELEKQVQHKKSMASLEELHTQFTLISNAIETVIDEMAASKNKTVKKYIDIPNDSTEHLAPITIEPSHVPDAKSFDPSQLDQLDKLQTDDFNDAIITPKKNKKFFAPTHKRTLSFFTVLEKMEENSPAPTPPTTNSFITNNH